MKHSFKAFSFALLALLSAQPALGSTSFPPELAKHLGVSTLPAPAPFCTLCHRDDVGGTGTVITPFGRSVLMRGTLPGSVPSLDAALDQLAASGTDSDSDGVSDIAELEAGTDPNQGAAGSENPLAKVPLPETGCAVRAPGSEPALAASLVAACFLLAGRRRRRGPRHQPRPTSEAGTTTS